MSDEKLTLSEWDKDRIRSEKINLATICSTVHVLLVSIMIIGLITGFAREMDTVVGVKNSTVVLEGMVVDLVWFGVGFGLVHAGSSVIFMRLATAGLSKTYDT